MGLTDRHEGPSHKYHFSPSSLCCPLRPTRQIMAASSPPSSPRPTRRPPSHPFCLSDVRCPPNASSAQTLDRHGQIFAGVTSKLFQVTFGGSGNFCPQSGEGKLVLDPDKKAGVELSGGRDRRGLPFLPFSLVILILMALKSRRIFRRISVGLHCEQQPTYQGVILGAWQMVGRQQILIPTARCLPTLCQELTPSTWFGQQGRGRTSEKLAPSCVTHFSLS